MILESPKSAINRSELSSAVLNNRFSGFKSTSQDVSISQQDSCHAERRHTPVYNSVIVEISHGRQCCSNDIRGIGLVVKSFSADSVEELSSQRKIGNEVHCMFRMPQNQYGLSLLFRDSDEGRMFDDVTLVFSPGTSALSEETDARHIQLFIVSK